MIVQTQKQKNISQTIEYLHTQAVVQHKENKFEEALSFYLQSIKLDENTPIKVGRS